MSDPDPSGRARRVARPSHDDARTGRRANVVLSAVTGRRPRVVGISARMGWVDVRSANSSHGFRVPVPTRSDSSRARDADSDAESSAGASNAITLQGFLSEDFP